MTADAALADVVGTVARVCCAAQTVRLKIVYRTTLQKAIADLGNITFSGRCTAFRACRQDPICRACSTDTRAELHSIAQVGRSTADDRVVREGVG